MGDAYRDDLAAAQARVADLEREHAALAEQNAKLEAIAAPAAKRAPHVFSRTGLTAGEEYVMLAVIVVAATISILLRVPRDWGLLVMLPVVFGAKGLLVLRRKLVAPTIEQQPRLAPPPAAPLSEEEANRARLAAALEREAEEKARRENNE